MMAGPPTNRTFLPERRFSIMPSATAATLSSFGRSADTSLDMKPKTDTGSLRGATTTLTAASWTSTRSPLRMRCTGTVSACGPSARSTKRHAAVHLDLLDGQPLPLLAHVAFEIGRRIEVGREDAVGRCRHPLGVVRDRVGAVLPDLLQDQVQHVLGLGAHDDLGVAGGLARRADLERRDLVVPAVQQDQIQHLREGARVDDVPVEVDGFARASFVNRR